MKFEKLTENKIRVIISNEDIPKENINNKKFVKFALENQDFFTKILTLAKKELNFDYEGSKLLIEAFLFSDEILIFTITKDSSNVKSGGYSFPKKLVAKRISSFSKKQAIYGFSSFENFCEFCYMINSISTFDFKKFSKNVALYLYNNTYYMIVENINLDYEKKNLFFSSVSEFSFSSFSNNFKNKLIEYGKPIIKKNAISIGAKFCCKI